MLSSLADDSVGFHELAVIIERFSNIAGRLIVLANFAKSTTVGEIATLEQACGRLGLNVVRSVSIALAIS